MRVIWVTPTIPHPAEAAGWAHEFELIKVLAHRHTIHVVSSDQNDPLDNVALRDIGVTLTRVPWRVRPFPRNRLTLAAGVLRANPNLVLWLRRDRLQRLASTIRDVSQGTRPEIVHITLGELAPLVRDMDTPTALLLFDSMTRVIEAELAISQSRLGRLQLRLDRRRTQRFEQRWYRRASGLAAVSSVDAEWFERIVGRPIDVIESVIGDHMFEPPQRQRTPGTVAFIGAINHRPNNDAIEWLVQEIWPIVRARRPEARLVVVGRGDRAGEITARVRAIVEGAGGILAADVDDIRPYYWDAAVVVAPMRLGAGMRNKVIHAMACRAPVVATPLALEGVPARAAASALTGTTTEEIADAIVRTLDDPDAAERRAEEAAGGVEPLRARVIAETVEAWWKRSTE